MLLESGFEAGLESLESRRLHSTPALLVLILEGGVEVDDAGEHTRVSVSAIKLLLLKRSYQAVVASRNFQEYA